MAEVLQITQDEVDKLVKEKADASFKAGLAKAKADREAEANNTETAEKLKELEILKADKAKREQESLVGNTVEAIKGLEITGLKKSAITRFAKENIEDLKGLEGEKLQAKIRAKFDKADEETKELMFDEKFVKTSGSFEPGDYENDDSKEVQYYPGTSIRKR